MLWEKKMNSLGKIIKLGVKLRPSAFGGADQRSGKGRAAGLRWSARFKMD